MKIIPDTIKKAIESFNKLPGIGPKTAERLVFYLLKKPQTDINSLADAIGGMKEGLSYCKKCKNFSTSEFCEICTDSTRQKEIICIVEDIMDLLAVEKTGAYKGLYHVLGGVISPVEGVGPEELTIEHLLSRLKEEKIEEIIFAVNPSIEGEATVSYLIQKLEPYKIKTTRIAHGIPVGGDLEYTDEQTLKRALQGRREY